MSNKFVASVFSSLFSKITKNIFKRVRDGGCGAVPTPEVHGLNLVFGNFINYHLL